MRKTNESQSSRPDKNKMILKYPASWWKGMWREALPSGNGIMGASVRGGIHQEVILLQHGELWHWGRKDELPNVSHTLQETRRLMDAGEYSEASWHLTRAVQAVGYASKLSSRFPLAELSLIMNGDYAFHHYRRELDMETGEIHVCWEEGERKISRSLFVSRADDCVVFRINAEVLSTNDSPQLRETGSTPMISGSVGLQFPPGDRERGDEEFKELIMSVTVRTDEDEQYIFYGGRNDDGQDYGAVMRLICVGDEPGAGVLPSRRALHFPGKGVAIPDKDQRDDSEKQAIHAELPFETSGDVLVLVKMFVTGKREEEWARLKQELAGLEADYNSILSRHTELHQPLFQSAELDLDDAADDRLSNEELLLDAYEGEAPLGLIRKMWAYGRYLFISGTSEGGNIPFGLYGLWGGDYRLIWGHHMANENVQMMYWHSAVGGLSCMNLSLFRYYTGLLDVFKENARKLYGCRGIYIPAGTMPGIGIPNQIVPVIMNWTGAAGWLARHYYEYFWYTGDMQFLREQALPFMREALQFYEDFLVLDDEGLYMIYPSVSPENTPQNFMPKDGKQLAHPMPTAINATMDVAIIKELLTHTIQASRIIGANTSKLPEWEAMLTRLPSYMLNEEGAVKEWLHPAFEDRQDHRHLSHLYPVFPGQEVSREEDPLLFEAFEKAVNQRKLGAQSGWSLAHMSSIYARLGDGERALDSLDHLARSCVLSNGFTLHNDWRNMGICLTLDAAPVQLDANMGWVNAVQEMLLQVSPQRIKLLPALPARMLRGELQNWRIPGGALSLAWDRKSGIFQAELAATRRISSKVQLPDWVDISLCKQHGDKKFKSISMENGAFQLHLEEGERWSVELDTV
ncbi:glycoside hydrolase N-terminal domain-containing protein [Paenibacillus sp. 7516]|uniref:glycosyl hydrolase family 95 catalytic domain-containing protein n=1 Tax=Paenibacillus sp. 7516 TaxID=2022549 RepID=UPI002015F691|nr:glycoside hydrolase N-terminal domain-containing protein [Paenibacillus sp. 7516]